MSRRRSRVKVPVTYEVACEICEHWDEDWTEPFCPFAMISEESRLVYCNSAYTSKCKECERGRYLYTHINIDKYPNEFMR